MSAALQPAIMPFVARLAAQPVHNLRAAAALGQRKPVASVQSPLELKQPAAQPQPETLVSWAFYRKHTESMLRRYLYASMQVGRSPTLLSESVGRGWVSSRRVRTFEDAVIFVLDIERCIARLSSFDQTILKRIVLQEYTHAETADMLGISARTVCSRLPQAIDNLTELLVAAELLVLPD